MAALICCFTRDYSNFTRKSETIYHYVCRSSSQVPWYRSEFITTRVMDSLISSSHHHNIRPKFDILLILIRIVHIINHA